MIVMEEKKNSVLIVDDEAINLKALMQILNQEYDVYAEKSGFDCISRAKSLRPDLILLDVLMPGMDGFEVIKRLKEDNDTAEIPVMFITGLSSQESEIQGFSLGAVDYIHKPFVEPIVKVRVQSQMKIVNLFKKVQSLSITDVLTGIGNRRYFNVQLNQEWDRAKRQQSPISFILMDIDNFKKFNDENGHLNGDMVLQGVASVISSVITRAADKAARWGGEEFAVILPDTELKGAEKIAENIRKAIENHEVTMEDGTVRKVTVSIGLHCTTPEMDESYSLKKFVSDTDKALYVAKDKGRNQVCKVESIIEGE